MREYDGFCKSLNNLKEALELDPPYAPVVEAGLVRLFEMCFERSWKLIRKILEAHGVFNRTADSPRQTVKSAYAYGMVSDEDGWLRLLELAGMNEPLCDEEQALEMIRGLREGAVSPFDDLKAELEENWLT